MARVRLLAPHYVGAGESSRWYDTGSVVDWPDDVPASAQMEGVDEDGRSLVAARRPVPNRPSRDRLPSLVRDPLARQPGMPRVAGPPGQEPAPSADPASPERTADIVEQRRERAEQQAEDDAAHAEERNAAREEQAAADRERAEQRRSNLDKANAARAAKRGQAANVQDAGKQPAKPAASPKKGPSKVDNE